MKKTISYCLLALWFIVMLASYWMFLPPLNPLSTGFWAFVLEGLFLAFGAVLLLSLTGKLQQVTVQMPGTRVRKVVSPQHQNMAKHCQLSVCHCGDCSIAKCFIFL